MSSSYSYNEFKHIGVDFADPQQVQKYDAQQNTNLAKERQLVQHLGITTGNIVLEFGPGTGAFTHAAAETGAQVISIDISEAMLSYSQNRAQTSGLSNIKFVRSGFLSYEHQGPFADFVVSKFALHHLPDFWKAIALERIAKMMSDGGNLYLKDVVFSFPPAEANIHLDQWIARVSTESGRGFSRAEYEMHIRDEFSTFGWILEEMLQRAGFEVVKAYYETPTYGEYTCRKRSS